MIPTSPPTVADHDGSAQCHASVAAHTPTPWSCNEWATTGPSAAAALVGERAMSDYGHAYCRVAQAQRAGQNAVAVAVGDSQIEASANAARIVACINALEGVADPQAFVAAAKAAGVR